MPRLENIIRNRKSQHITNIQKKRRNQMAKIEQRKWLSVLEFRQLFPQLSRTFVYESVRAGRLPSIKIGGKILIPDDALDTLLEASK